jgi:hypothetical protein
VPFPDLRGQQARGARPDSDIAESSGRSLHRIWGAQSGNLTKMQIASASDRRGPAVNNMPLVSSTAVFALVATCVVTLISPAALGACNTTLRGELAPGDRPNQPRAVPPKLLFFSLNEITEAGGNRVATIFQSFAFPNTKTTFPIPFALNIDSPKDCPRELTLHVVGSDHDGFHYEYPLNGWKKISLDKFESILVYPPTF